MPPCHVAAPSVSNMDHRAEVAQFLGSRRDRITPDDFSGVSPEMLDSLSQALRLDEAESAHLHDLARAAAPRPPRRRKRPEGSQTVGSRHVRPDPRRPDQWRNAARFMLLDPEAEELSPEWDLGAGEIGSTQTTATDHERAYCQFLPLLR